MPLKLHFFLIVLISLISIYASGQSFQEDTARVNMWNAQSKSIRSKNFESAILFADSAVKLSEKIKYKSGRGEAILNQAIAYDLNGNFETALHMYDSAQVIFKDAGERLGEARAIQNKGVAYYYMGNLDSASQNYINSLKVFKKLNYYKGVSSCLNNLGLIARRQGNSIKALDYYKESIQIKKLQGDKVGELRSSINVESLYIYLKDYDEALKYNSKNLKMAKELDEELSYAETLNNLGSIMNGLGRYEEALEYLEQSRPQLLAQNDYKPLSVNLLTTAYIYLEFEQLDSAYTYLKKGEKLLDQVESVESRLELLKGYNNYYTLKGKFKKANDYLQQYITLKIQVDNQSSSQKIRALEAQYSYLEQKKQISELHEKNRIETLINKQQAFRQNVLLIAIIVLALIIVYIIYLIRVTRKQKKSLEVALNDREVLIKEVHHRVKNNLQTVSGLLYLQSESLENKDALEALSTSRSRVEAISIIHQQLYSDDNLVGVNMNEYLAELVDLIKEVNQVDFEVEISLHVAPIHLDVDSTIPIGLIINELICNAFKYAFDPMQTLKKIKVELLKVDEKLELTVQDNGLNSKSNEVKGTGFGSQLIDMFVKKLRGEMTLSKDKGYRVELMIKKFKEIHVS